MVNCKAHFSIPNFEKFKITKKNRTTEKLKTDVFSDDNRHAKVSTSNPAGQEGFKGWPLVKKFD